MNGTAHTMRIAKAPDGTLWFVMDGIPIASPYLKNSFEKDHSAWNTLLIRVRRGTEGEEYVFTALKMGAKFEKPALRAARAPAEAAPPAKVSPPAEAPAKAPAPDGVQ